MEFLKMDEELFAQLQQHMPPLFLATKLDEYTGHALCWRTIKNQRCNKDYPDDERIPEECFLRQSSRKTLIVRDELLAWWKSVLTRPVPQY